ncbi:eukaryotic translation initiation factor 3 subunit F-like [Cinclus cinclus]|uniref:eukaryotic translation initiation factor 3 subunit F-like n=1 Tax=Cinclus cinclus TaxID=127875 RepID=UPI002E16618F
MRTPGAAGLGVAGVARRSPCPGRFQPRSGVCTGRFRRRSPGHGYRQSPGSLRPQRDHGPSPTAAAAGAGAAAPGSAPAPVPGRLLLPAAIPMPMPVLRSAPGQPRERRHRSEPPADPDKTQSRALAPPQPEHVGLRAAPGAAPGLGSAQRSER